MTGDKFTKRRPEPANKGAMYFFSLEEQHPLNYCDEEWPFVAYSKMEKFQACL